MQRISEAFLEVAMSIRDIFACNAWSSKANPIQSDYDTFTNNVLWQRV